MQEKIAIVGDGRLGRALSSALRAPAPHGRGYAGADADAVLLCVPDAQIAAAAAVIEPGRLVGHCSGATGLDVLAPHEAFGLHPLMTVTRAGGVAVLLRVPDAQIAAAATAIEHGPLVGHCSGATGLDVLAPHEAFGLHPLMTVTRAGGALAGAGCAIAGTTPRAVDLAERLGLALGMRPFAIAEDDRVAYHAAASMASNFLVTLESAAARLAATAGVERTMLVPLVRAAVEAWAVEGDASLTGPIVRGDEATVARHREAIGERAPELLGLYDVLADATRAVAAA